MSPSAGHGNTTKEELDPDEPRTPLWLPLLGLGLFLSALIYFIVGQTPSPVESGMAPPSTSASAAPSAAPAP